MSRHEREQYDDMLDAGGEPERDCPVCWGGHGEPCTEDCAELFAKAQRAERLRLRRVGLLAQAQASLRLAKRYRAEEGPGGVRERACLDVVAGCRLRRAIAGYELRAMKRSA